MAGNGGFKSALNGFDKNEVNEYIGNLRKKLQEMEAEIKSNEEKTKAAVKTAEEADSKIAELEKKHAARVSELEAQAKTERRNADTLQNENDELKRKLRHATNASQSAARPGVTAATAASVAEAEKKAAEVVEKANAQAKEIVEKAKQTAHEIIAGAGGGTSGGASQKSAEEFGAILKELSKTVTDALNAAIGKASEITVGAGASVPELDLSAFEAPRAEVPAAKAEPAAKTEPTASSADSMSMDDLFSGLSDDGDMEDFGDVKPLDPTGKPRSEVVEGFDLSDVGKFDEPDAVTEVEPIDKKAGGAVMDEDFTAELLTQTVPSSALKDQIDEDLLAAVKEREEQFAVQPSDDKKDFDMDDASGGLDAMNALLGQMGAALENAGGSASTEFDSPAAEPMPADMSSSDNPWAELQSQLNAMEESGNFGGADGSSETAASSEPEAAPAAGSDDPKAPDADDSSIWNFDSDMGSDSSDDDMSSDLFGSF